MKQRDTAVTRRHLHVFTYVMTVGRSCFTFATCFFVSHAKHNRVVIATVARYFSVTFRPLCVKRETHVARMHGDIYLSVCPSVYLSIYLSGCLSIANNFADGDRFSARHLWRTLSRGEFNAQSRYFRRPVMIRDGILSCCFERRVQKTSTALIPVQVFFRQTRLDIRASTWT